MRGAIDLDQDECEPFRVEPQDCRLRSGFDEHRFTQLADELEAEAVADKLAQSE